VEDDENFCAVPGQVLAVGAGHVDMACGTGKLRLFKVQLEGGGEIGPDRLISSIRMRLT
jgi:methionyl-tRNA formyltransferase